MGKLSRFFSKPLDWLLNNKGSAVPLTKEEEEGLLRDREKIKKSATKKKGDK